MAITKPSVSYAALRGRLKMPAGLSGDEKPETSPPAAATGGEISTGQAAPAALARARRSSAPDNSTIAASTSPAGRYAKVRTPYPQPGSNREFDNIATIYGPKKAMQIVLKRALDRWMEAYTEETPIHEAAGYAATKNYFDTSRAIDDRIMRSVKARIDPLDILPPYALVQRICLSAMTEYLAARGGPGEKD